MLARPLDEQEGVSQGRLAEESFTESDEREDPPVWIIPLSRIQTNLDQGRHLSWQRFDSLGANPCRRIRQRSPDLKS